MVSGRAEREPEGRAGGDPASTSSPVFRAFLVVGAYLGLAILATWPLGLHFWSHAPGADWWRGHRLFYETPVNLWNLWWFHHSLTVLGESPFFCPLIFHPHGANLWRHTLSPLHGFLATPLLEVLPLPAVHNLLLWANLAGAGLCTFLLGKHVGLRPGAAFVAGGLFACSPAVFAHLYVGHFELLATLWMPLCLLLFLRLLEAPAGRQTARAVALGLVLPATAYASQYYFVFSGLLLGLAALVYRRQAMAQWRPLLLAVVLAVSGLSPIAYGYMAADSGAPTLPEDFASLSADPVGFVVPSFTHPWSAPLSPIHERLHGTGHPEAPTFEPRPQETTVFLGWSVLGLAGLGLLRWREELGRRRLLATIFVVLMLLSLGSELRLFGLRTGVPLPGAVMAHIPLLREARAPARWVIPAGIGLMLLAGAGWQQLRDKRLRVGILLFAGLEYLALPVPLFDARPPEIYQHLAMEPGTFAVLELPFGLRDGRYVMGQPISEQLLGQTVHGRAIPGGMVSRLPLTTWEEFLGAPVLGTLLDPRPPGASTLARDRRLGPSYFERQRIHVVVVHPEAQGGGQHRYLESVLPVARRERLPDGTELLWLTAIIRAVPSGAEYERRG